MTRQEMIDKIVQDCDRSQIQPCGDGDVEQEVFLYGHKLLNLMGSNGTQRPEYFPSLRNELEKFTNSELKDALLNEPEMICCDHCGQELMEVDPLQGGNAFDKEVESRVEEHEGRCWAAWRANLQRALELWQLDHLQVNGDTPLEVARKVAEAGDPPQRVVPSPPDRNDLEWREELDKLY